MSRLWPAAGALLVTSLLAGCSSVTSSLQQSLGDATSATATAALATKLQLDGAAPLSYVATVYGDALTELQGAEDSVSSLDATPNEAVRRATVLGTIRRAVDAVITAQEDLNAGAGLKTDSAALAAATAALKKVAKP